LKPLLSSFNSEIPFQTTEDQLSWVQQIGVALEIHLSSLFDNFKSYTIRSMTNPNNPVAVFMTESFLEDIEDPSILQFIEPFLSSQIFTQYSEYKLMKQDQERIRVNL